MKSLFVLFFVIISFAVLAQNTAIPTEKFSVEGRVKQKVTFSIADLDTFKINALQDITITNHLGEKKHTITGLKGVLLKDILGKVEFDAENPKVLSEYYFEFVATDNYKIVFSWNEIYNTETGDNIYIVMEEDGKKIKDIPGRVSIVTLTDFKTGRRHMSNIDKIIVQRVQ
jgi:hypothetical protein